MALQIHLDNLRSTVRMITRQIGQIRTPTDCTRNEIRRYNNAVNTAVKNMEMISDMLQTSLRNVTKSNANFSQALASHSTKRTSKKTTRSSRTSPDSEKRVAVTRRTQTSEERRVPFRVTTESPPVAAPPTSEYRPRLLMSPPQ